MNTLTHKCSKYIYKLQQTPSTDPKFGIYLYKLNDYYNQIGNGTSSNDNNSVIYILLHLYSLLIKQISISEINYINEKWKKLIKTENQLIMAIIMLYTKHILKNAIKEILYDDNNIIPKIYLITSEYFKSKKYNRDNLTPDDNMYITALIKGRHKFNSIIKNNNLDKIIFLNTDLSIDSAIYIYMYIYYFIDSLIYETTKEYTDILKYIIGNIPNSELFVFIQNNYNNLIITNIQKNINLKNNKLTIKEDILKQNLKKKINIITNDNIDDFVTNILKSITFILSQKKSISDNINTYGNFISLFTGNELTYNQKKYLLIFILGMIIIN